MRGSYRQALTGCLAAAAASAAPAIGRAQDQSDPHRRYAPWADLRAGVGVHRVLCNPARNESCPGGNAAGYSIALAGGVAASPWLLVGGELRHWSQIGWFEAQPFTPDRATFLLATGQATPPALRVLSLEAAAGAVRHRQAGDAETTTHPAAGVGLVLARPTRSRVSPTLHADYLRAFGGSPGRPRLVEVGVGMRWR